MQIQTKLNPSSKDDSKSNQETQAFDPLLIHEEEVVHPPPDDDEKESAEIRQSRLMIGVIGTRMEEGGAGEGYRF